MNIFFHFKRKSIRRFLLKFHAKAWLILYCEWRKKTSCWYLKWKRRFLTLLNFSLCRVLYQILSFHEEVVKTFTYLLRAFFSMKIIFYWSNRFKELTLTYKTIQRKSQLLNQIIIPVFFIRNPSVLELFLIQCVKNPQVLLYLLFVWISKKLINAELV